MKHSLLILALSFMSPFYASAKTLYTGDKIQGVPVISQLDVADLPAGHHRFMFQGAETGSAQHWYVPVMVAKGATDGKKMLLQAGIHGDELNGIRTLQEVMMNADPAKMSGTIVAVMGANRSGVENVSRYWKLGADHVDFNRIFPGKEAGDAAERQAWLLWSNLYANNVDYVMDYHTGSTGHTYQLFIYSDYRQEQAQVMAELFPADQIKKDPGEKGTVETTFIEAGIPAITVELGSPRNYDKDMITRGVIGTRNVLAHYGILPNDIVRTAKTQQTYIGNQLYTVKAQKGGFADILVNVGDEVREDQLVALQRNAFGDVIAEYKAQKAGKVLGVGSDATREPDAMLVRLLTINDDEKCQLGC